MPRYDYQCERGHRYEKQESFGAPAQQPCEKCGAPANRQFGAPSIVFKGSGWYSTDSQRTLRAGVGSRDGEVGGSETHSAAEAASEGPSAAVGTRAPRKAAEPRAGRAATDGSKPVVKPAAKAAKPASKAAKVAARPAAKATKSASKVTKAAAKTAVKAAKPATKTAKAAARPVAKRAAR